MVELRKRASTSSAVQPPTKRSNAKKVGSNQTQASLKKPISDDKIPKKLEKAAETAAADRQIPSKSKSDAEVARVGAHIGIETFGGEFGLTDGTTNVTLKLLLERSDKGVILFTYPKASTPGCTKQACLFRDSYEDLTSSGYDVYGLSRDSVKANTNFKAKQKLQFDLLCDDSGELIKALGFQKAPQGTFRGVAAIGKDGKIHVLTTGGPDATLDAVRPIIKQVSDT